MKPIGMALLVAFSLTVTSEAVAKMVPRGSYSGSKSGCVYCNCSHYELFGIQLTGDSCPCAPAAGFNCG